MSTLLWGIVILWCTFSCYNDVESFGFIQTELDLWVTMDNSNLPLYALCLNYLLRTDCLSIWITLGTLMKYHQLTGARFLLTVPHPQPFLFFFFFKARNAGCSEIWNKCKGRHVDGNIHPGCMPYGFLLSHLFHPSFCHNCWPLGKRKGEKKRNTCASCSEIK